MSYLMRNNCNCPLCASAIRMRDMVFRCNDCMAEFEIVDMGLTDGEYLCEQSNMLGDNCNNKCNECFGDKDVRICKEDFKVVGEMLEMITIKKGSWWSLVFMNHDHVLLDGLDGHQLTLKRDLFERYFENFVYEVET